MHLCDPTTLMSEQQVEDCIGSSILELFGNGRLDQPTQQLHDIQEVALLGTITMWAIAPPMRITISAPVIRSLMKLMTGDDVASNMHSIGKSLPSKLLSPNAPLGSLTTALGWSCTQKKIGPVPGKKGSRQATEPIGLCHPSPRLKVTTSFGLS